MTYKVFTPGQPSTLDLECPGSVEEPKAEPGVLCVYQTKRGTNQFAAPFFVLKTLPAELAEPEQEQGVSPAGALLFFGETNIPIGKTIVGTFAVTAP